MAVSVPSVNLYCLIRYIHSHLRGEKLCLESILSRSKIARNYLKDDHIRNLRDHFWELLQKNFGTGVVLNGHPIYRLPNTLNISFVGRIGGEILSQLDGVAASTGAACHYGSVELSQVLKAMGIPPEVGMGAIRFSLGRTTTLQELEKVVGLIRLLF